MRRKGVVPVPLFVIGVSLIAALLSARSAPAADSGSPRGPWERFSLSAGGFATSFDTNLRFGTTGGGIEINAEEALGLDSELGVFRALASYRIGERRRHRLDLSYFSMRRDATRTLTADVPVDNGTIAAGSVVDSRFNIQIIKAGYSYSFFQDDRLDLAVGLGVYVAPITVSLESVGVTQASQDFTAPLPSLHLRFDVAITPKLFLRQSIDLFYLEYGSFRGGLIDTMFGLEYKPWKSFGFGAALNSFNLVVEAQDEDYPVIDLVGRIQFGYRGLLLYAKYYY